MYFKKLLKELNDFIWFIINRASVLSLFECIAHPWSLSLEERKLVAIVNCVLNMTDILRLFMTSFKNGLISGIIRVLRYYLIDRVLFSSLLPSYRYTVTIKLFIIYNYSVLDIVSFFSLLFIFVFLVFLVSFHY